MEEDQQNLQKEEKKLEELQNQHDRALKLDGYYEDILQELNEQFFDVLSDVAEYEEKEKQLEEVVTLLENEFQMENQLKEVEKQNMATMNQQLESDTQEFTEENSIAQENQENKEKAVQEKDNSFKEIQDAKNKIDEITQDQRNVEEAKRQKQKQERKKKGIFGLLSACVSAFFPIAGVIVSIVGSFVTNGDYDQALKYLNRIKEDKIKQKEKSQGLLNRFSEMENISEERYQKAIKSAQNKSSSILQGLNTKKEVEQKINSLKDSMSAKMTSINEKTQKKFHCEETIKYLKDLHQEVEPKIQKLKVEMNKSDLPTVSKNLVKQQQVVQNLRVNFQKINKPKQIFA